MVENINPYDADLFKNQFESNDFVQKMYKEPFTDVVWEDTFKQRHKETLTGRHHAYRRVMYMASFYYLEFLQYTRPAKIYDIGCGANLFSLFYPNIVGISGPNIRGDDETPFGDELGTFDSEYVKANASRFESAFSINALHFTNFESLQKVMQDFIALIKPGGRGYLALNIARLDDHSGSQEMLELFNAYSGEPDYKYRTVDRKAIYRYIRDAVSQLHSINILSFEIVATADEYIDGNIRLVFEKNV